MEKGTKWKKVTSAKISNLKQKKKPLLKIFWNKHFTKEGGKERKSGGLGKKGRKKKNNPSTHSRKPETGKTQT